MLYPELAATKKLCAKKGSACKLWRSTNAAQFFCCRFTVHLPSRLTDTCTCLNFQFLEFSFDIKVKICTFKCTKVRVYRLNIERKVCRNIVKNNEIFAKKQYNTI